MPEELMMDLDRLGTLDEALAKAEELATHYKSIAANVLSDQPDLTNMTMVFMSLLTRLQGLHDGAVREIRAENPHGALPLLRAFTETTAFLVYINDRTEYVATLRKSRDEARRLTAAAIVDHARPRMPGIRAVYEQLCQVAHFDSIAFALPFIVDEREEDVDAYVNWQSKPRWKSEREALTACGLVVELAEASHQLLGEFAEKHLPTQSNESQ